MGARDDLMAVGAELAARARAQADSGAPIAYETVRMAGLAEGARAALQAAALVDAEPAPIIAATERLHAKLEELGTHAGLDVAASFGAAEAIDAVTDVVEVLTREIRAGAAVVRGYGRLHQLAQDLQRDFTAAKSETATRIAARIATGLEEADDLIRKARGQETRDG